MKKVQIKINPAKKTSYPIFIGENLLDNARLKVILIDGTEIDISRSYKTAFSEKYNIFLRNFS